MTVPAAFTTGLAARYPTAVFWLEIAGWPTCYGNVAKTSAWFSTRAAAQQFDEIKPWAALESGEPMIPELTSQEIDHVEGRVSMGQLRFRVVDVDDSLATLTAIRRTSDWLRLTTTIAYGTASLVYGIDASNAGGSATWAASGRLYVGRECVKYSSFTGTTSGTFTASQRGAYRSLAGPHTGSADETDDNADQLGALLTPYPRALAGRRCWMYLGLDADDATEAVCVFSGVIRSVGWQESGRVLVLSCDDQQAELAKPLFVGSGTQLVPRTYTLSTMGSMLPGSAPPTTYEFTGQALLFGESSLGLDAVYTQDHTFDGNNEDVEFLLREGGVYAFQRDTSLDAGLTASFPGAIGFRFLGLASGSIPAPLASVLSESLTDRERSRRAGLVSLSEGSSGGAADAGPWPIRPAVVIRRYDANDDVLSKIKFTQGNHPLDVLLQLLLSTGDATNGDYDVLPAEWGCGIPAADVDVAGIESIRRATGNYAVHLVVLEPVKSAREWIVKELLQPFGFYLKPTLGATLSVGWMRDADPTELLNAATITDSDLAVDDAGQIMRLDGPIQDAGGVVGALEFHASPELREDKLELAQVLTATVPSDADDRGVHEDYRTVKIESHGLHGLTATASAAPFEIEGWSAAAVAVELLASYRSRFAQPPSIVTVDVGLGRLALNVGELVAVTLTHLPVASSTTRGTQRYCEIAQRRVDLARGVVTLDLAETAIGTVPVRFVAPACDVTAWTDGTKTLTVSQNAYTLAGGDYSDPEAFAVGDELRIYTADMSSRSAVTTLVSRTATTLVIDKDQAALGLTPASGYVVVHADYGEVDATTKAKYAFCAGNDERLATDDAPHRWG